MGDSLTIAVDFDGTIVEHQYPKIGPLVPGAIEGIKLLKDCGFNIVLNTMRGDDRLAEAVQFLLDNGIELDGVNRANNQDWTTSPKVYAQYYIDDASVGIPIISEPRKRVYVDWSQTIPLLLERIRKEHGTLI